MKFSKGIKALQTKMQKIFTDPTENKVDVIKYLQGMTGVLTNEETFEKVAMPFPMLKDNKETTCILIKTLAVSFPDHLSFFHTISESIAATFMRAVSMISALIVRKRCSQMKNLMRLN